MASINKAQLVQQGSTTSKQPDVKADPIVVMTMSEKLVALQMAKIQQQKLYEMQCKLGKQTLGNLLKVESLSTVAGLAMLEQYCDQHCLSCEVVQLEGGDAELVTQKINPAYHAQ